MAHPPEDQHRIIGLLFFAVIVASATYWFSVTKWWIADDPAILKFAAQHSILQYFFLPKIWRQFTPVNLTPMVLLSFKVDLLAFGLNPNLFYLHQISVAALTAILLFLLLQRYTASLAAALASICFFLLPPATQCISLLMTRHYIEGLLLCTLGLLFYSKHLESRRGLHLLVSVVCYALASLCKEVFVPLPLVLLFWPPDSHEGESHLTNTRLWLRERLKTALPFLLWLLVYAAYRRWMLGRFVGGYGSMAGGFSPLSLAKALYSGLFANPVLAILCGAAVVLTFYYQRSPKRLIFLGVILLCTEAPLMPISNSIAERHLLLPSLLLAIALGWGINLLWHTKRTGKAWIAMGLALASLLLSFQSHLNAQLRFRPMAHSFEKTGRFLWYKSTSTDAVVNSSIPNWYYNGLEWLKENFEHKGPMGQGISNLCYAAALGGYSPERPLWIYEAKEERVVRISPEKTEEMVKSCLSRFKEKPLHARFWEKGNTIHWEFGPYTKGSFSLVDRKTGYPYPLPAKGTFPATFESLNWEVKNIVICYEAPEGWRTCTTPVITKERPASFERRANH